MIALSHSKKKATCKVEIYDVVWFTEELSKRLNKTIKVNEIGYESILLEHDEVDEDMIPSHHLKALPNPFLAHSFIYDEEEGYEWICVVVTDESNQSKHYESWFKNSEKIK